MALGRGRDPPGRGGARALKGRWIARWIPLRGTGLWPALRVHRQRPLRGALRVHDLPTPAGSTWKTLTRFPHRPGQRSISSSTYLKFVHTGTAALRWPLLLHHLTGLRLRPNPGLVAATPMDRSRAVEYFWQTFGSQNRLENIGCAASQMRIV